jgi:hypothetical protein
VDPANPASTLVLGAGAQDMIDELRTFGTSAPPRTSSVVPGQVRVQVIDGFRKSDAETRAPAVTDELVKHGFRARPKHDPKVKEFLSQVRYGPSQIAAAKLLASYLTDASLVLDPTLGDQVQLVLGVIFAGLEVPAVPTSPVATEAPTSTTVPAPASTTSTTTTTTTPVDAARAACA